MSKIQLKNVSNINQGIPAGPLDGMLNMSDSGILDGSGLIDDSGLIGSGIVHPGIVEPDEDDEDDLNNPDNWDYCIYTEEEMYQLMRDGNWKGGIVNGAYIPPTSAASIIGSHHDGDNGNVGNSGNTGVGNDGGNGNNNGNTGDGNYGGHQSGSNAFVVNPSWGEVSNGNQWYTVEEAEQLMNTGNWVGGYVIGWGYVLPEVTIFSNNTPNTGAEILARARAFEGTPYLLGGNNRNGIDCSGLICAACNLGYRWTTSVGAVPGCRRISYGTEEVFWHTLKEGDILLFPKHVAIFVEGTSIFHSSSSRGVGMTSDLESYWIKKNGFPKIFRR